MPRHSKGARLWLEPEERSTDGKIGRRASWVIRDGSVKLRTGCAQGDRSGAEQALAEYIARKYQAPRDRSRHPSEILIADVLNIYLADKAPRHSDPKITTSRVMTLAEFWGDRTLSAINGTTCREYVAYRIKQPWRSARPDATGNAPRMVTEQGARRELEDLRSAINHHRREGLCSEVVSVTLPERGEAGADWLTRNEAARLLWAAWRARQAFGEQKTDRATGRHIARFILVGLYTGTRHAAICGAAFQPAIGRGHIDLDAGIFHRRAAGARETKKRQPPVRLPDRLLTHLRRWQRRGIAKHAVVEWNGRPVKSVRKGFAAAVKTSGLRPVTPHILRHTAATYAMQRGANIWEAAGWLGMSEEVLARVYAHHHPDFQSDVANRVTGTGSGQKPREQTRIRVNERDKKPRSYKA